MNGPDPAAAPSQPLPLPLSQPDWQSCQRMIEALLRPEAYDHPVERLQLLETHISWVLLTGAFAYKIKKPVHFGFVDFSSAELRHHFCLEELRLNRRLAPDLYLAVVPIHGPAESASFREPFHSTHATAGADPALAPIEHAVRMRQFPQEALLPAVLEREGLPLERIDRLAADLAAFHAAAASAAPDSGFGEPEQVLRPAQANLDSLATSPAAAPFLAELQGWTTARFRELEPTFERRRRQGRIRECHGDLHLGNMVLRRGAHGGSAGRAGEQLTRIEVFDCLEFSPALRWIDPISDLAFLVMDLQERGHPELGARLLAGWLERSGDYDGLPAWRWYLVYRALVRAKVSALRLAQPSLPPSERDALQDQLQGYLQQALRTSRPRPTRLLAITHGVSGSGKSWLARQLAARLGWIQLRSDIERKRLFGREGEAMLDALPASGYSEAVSERLYGQVLPEQAAAILAAGLDVVVDATFLRREQRRCLQERAERLGAGFVILDCTVPPAVAARRLELRRQRERDPSDADAAVLRAQQSGLEPLTPEERRCALACGEALSGEGEERLASRLEPLVAELRAWPTGALRRQE